MNTPEGSAEPEPDCRAGWRWACPAGGEPVVYSSLDEVVGPAVRRFFVEGYRRVRHVLRDVAVEAGGPGPGRVTGSAVVCYPADWSVNEAGPGLRPHLCTIDAWVLAARLSECYLAYGLGLDEGQRRRAWLRSGQVRAGSRPQEEMDRFPVQAQVAYSRPSPASLRGYLTAIDCLIGPLKVRYEVEHDPGAGPAGSSAPAGELPGAGGYYANGYRQVRHDLSNLHIDPVQSRAAAVVTVREPAEPGDGLEACYRPALSGVDATIVAAQLAQALVHQLDDTPRGATGTLWMRRVAYTSPTPYQPVANPFIATVSLNRSLVIRKDGRRWRTADLEAQLLGIHGTFSVTHVLPG